MTEDVERIIAADLSEHEYNVSQPDQRAWLSQAAARRIVATLVAKGYVIQKVRQEKA
jgi:DNA-binding IclR family transcriptional regulator